MSKKHYFPKGDTMMYTCQITNPHTGGTWVDVEAVKTMLRDRYGHTVSDYALIVHDRDVVTEGDVLERKKQRVNLLARLYFEYMGEAMSKEDAQNFSSTLENLNADAMAKAMADVDKRLPDFHEGDVKPAHVHIVLILCENRKTNEVANWFEGCAQAVPELITLYKDNVRKSGDRKKNALLYLVHKNAPEKAQYSASEVSASFDYDLQLERLIELASIHAQYQVSPDEVNDFINLIEAGKKTARDFILQYTYAIYTRNKKNIDVAEMERIKKHCIVPNYRCVLYFDSIMDDRARIGKTTACYEVARRIAISEYKAPEDVFCNIESVKKDNPFIFTASVQTMFEGYAGQPIVILDDFRAGDLKAAFKSRAAIKVFLDPHPTSTRFHVKYSSVIPIPKYVFISGIDPFRTFIDDLSNLKTREEKETDLASQFFGRFWLRCTFIDSTRYIVYKNREHYPCSQKVIKERFYETLPYLCSVPAVLHSNLSSDKKAEILAKGLDPIFQHAMSYEFNSAKTENLDEFFAMYGKPAIAKYDGYNQFFTEYDDSRDAPWYELYDSITKDVYTGYDEDTPLIPFPEVCENYDEMLLDMAYRDAAAEHKKQLEKLVN